MSVLETRMQMDTAGAVRTWMAGLTVSELIGWVHMILQMIQLQTPRPRP